VRRDGFVNFDLLTLKRKEANNPTNKSNDSPASIINNRWVITMQGGIANKKLSVLDFTDTGLAQE